MAQHLTKDRLRANIAYEAARILNDLGQCNFTAARNKAAQRLGCKDKGSLPSNSEIEQALLEYQQLFHADDNRQALQQQRKLALEAMANLRQFSPRLVGPALSGSAGSNTPLQLHLFADCPEEIAYFLMDRGIPYREGEKTVFLQKGKRQKQPLFRFRSGDTELELIWFPTESIGHPPLSPIDQKPEKRVSAKQLISLLEDT